MASRRLSSDSSSMQVVALVLGSEGASIANNLMNLRTGPIDDGSEFLPR